MQQFLDGIQTIEKARKEIDKLLFAPIRKELNKYGKNKDGTLNDFGAILCIFTALSLLQYAIKNNKIKEILLLTYY